ncbi:MAG: carboxymuconolactone decarboxylase family protein [Chloroflexi bacterium]|nr:carboxymuconolactone decarboxylase family protein [Chloroflexota bacterium]
MPHIHLLDRAQVDPSLSKLLDGPMENVIRGLAYQPARLNAWLKFYSPLIWEDGALEVELKELVRLQIAAYYDCDVCQSVRNPMVEARGLTEDKVECVARPGLLGSERLSDRERTALSFSWKMTVDHESLGPADFEKLRAHFNEEQIVELGWLASAFIGFGRLTRGFDLLEL